MNSIKYISNFSLKDFRRCVLLPLTALLLVVALGSSPFLSIAWGQAPVTYSIEYDMGMGGINPGTNPIVYNSSVDTPIADAYKPGYKFQGWAVTYWATGTQLGPQKSFVISAGTHGIVELAAIFDTNIQSYPITYELDGGTNHPSNRVNYAADNENFPIDINAPTKSGYAFSGWTVKYTDGTPEITTPVTSFSINAGTTGSITLQAKWAPLNLMYTVNYLEQTTDKVLAPQKIANAQALESLVTEDAIDIDGYNKAEPTSKTIPIQLTGNVFNFYYTARNDLSYTVKYVDTAGNKLSPDKVVENAIFGVTYTEEAKNIPNYEVDETQKSTTITTSENVITFIYKKATVTAPVKVTFLPGNEECHDCNFTAHVIYVNIGEKPIPPHPYAKFSYKFIGWKNLETGITYYALDYTKPMDVNLPPVEKAVIYEAQWALVNPRMQFPDKISSAEHFDRWWGDYGILCFAASTTKDDMYTIMFADWFFDVYKSCTIGFGTPGKMSYEIVFEQNNIRMYQITGNGAKDFTPKGDGIIYSDKMTCIRDGQYYSKGMHNYGLDFGMNGFMQGVTFVNPFGNGAKQAWLY